MQLSTGPTRRFDLDQFLVRGRGRAACGMRSRANRLADTVGSRMIGLAIRRFPHGEIVARQTRSFGCPRAAHFGAIWPAVSFSGLLVRLADGVVPWHTFNLVGFGPVNFQACHSKYQSSRCQAETLSLYRCGIDLLG
jgi:hypothetical protein